MISWKPYLQSSSETEYIYEKKADQSGSFYTRGLFQYNDDTVNFFRNPVLALKAAAVGQDWLTENEPTKDEPTKDRPTKDEPTKHEPTGGEARKLEAELTLVKLVGNSDVRRISLQSSVYWSGKEQWLYLNKEQFGLPLSREREYSFVSRVRVSGDHPFKIEEIRFQKSDGIRLETTVSSKAAKPGETLCFPVLVGNDGPEAETVVLRYGDDGWKEWKPIFSASVLRLLPGEEQTVTVTVDVTDTPAPGGYERLNIWALPKGQCRGRRELALWPGRSMPHPHGVLDGALLDEIRDKIRRYAWAKAAYEKGYAAAEAWEAPEIDLTKDYLFQTEEAHRARDCAILFHLSGETRFAEKTARFLREWSDPVRGYLRLPRAGNQELVHDGEFFKSAATAYDLIYDWEGWTKEDRCRLERTMRFYMDYIDVEVRSGEASNWLLAELAGAVYCAAVLEDRERLERFLYGPGGAADQLARGVFDDGWWYEASIGYNLMCAGLFSEMALAAAHFGIDFAHIKVQPSYRRTNCVEGVRFDGLVNDAWGENRKNYRSIDMLWDSLIPFYDDRGVIMGINDSAEQKSNARTKAFYKLDYELAYRLYRKPEYAYMISRLGDDERNLIFGEGKRPACDAAAADGAKRRMAPYEISCRAENAGLVVLRSQKENCSAREQIQVGIKCGSHGGAHGHYDRTGMTGLMRYGKSLTNPENIWYSYHTFMYKFYCQTSVNHNMVTVDLKQQEAVEPKSLLFYSGTMLQAFACQNMGRWSYPPFGGWPVGGQKTIEERQWEEGRWFPVLPGHPPYASRSGFTEEVLTRRLTLVADDYAVNFDYAESEKPHRFQCLYHLQGLREIDGAVSKTCHTEQLEADPRSSAQFITDCDWYRAAGTVRFGFQAEYSEFWNNYWKFDWKWQNRTAYNEYGTVYTDLYYVHEPEAKSELAAACPPEFALVNKRLSWTVSGETEDAEERILASGAFGAWILGKERIDVGLSGIKRLKLQAAVENGRQGDLNQYESLNTIFWGNPVLVTEDGQSIDFRDLPLERDNINPGYGPGVDYEGGRVTIQAELFDKAIPAEPLTKERPGVITVDLSGLHAVRFCGVIGGDYPVGDESRKRRTILEQQEGTRARFITVIEPHEKEAMITEISRPAPWELKVRLRDGRLQHICVEGMEEALPDGRPSRICAVIREYDKDGKLIRQEQTQKDIQAAGDAKRNGGRGRQ